MKEKVDVIGFGNGNNSENLPGIDLWDAECFQNRRNCFVANLYVLLPDLKIGKTPQKV